MAAQPTVTPPASADNSPIGTIGQAGGNYQGLVLQQLQIISLLLREGLNVRTSDYECWTLVQPSTPTLS